VEPGRRSLGHSVSSYTALPPPMDERRNEESFESPIEQPQIRLGVAAPSLPPLLQTELATVHVQLPYRRRQFVVAIFQVGLWGVLAGREIHTG